LEAASKEVKRLTIEKQKHEEIKKQLKTNQDSIKAIGGGIGDMEWEYEVKL